MVSMLRSRSPDLVVDLLRLEIVAQLIASLLPTNHAESSFCTSHKGVWTKPLCGGTSKPKSF